MKLSDIAKNFTANRSAVVRARGALRRLRPDTLDGDARAHLARLRDESEVVRRLPQRDQDRIASEVRNELTATRSRAASVARHGLRGVREYVRQGQAAIAAARRDTRTSFPEALDGLSADGMATAELLRMQIFDRLSQASPAQLLSTYQRALSRQDLRGFIEASAVEEMADGGALTARSDDELPTLKSLREYVADVQDVRLPTDLPDFAELAANCDRLDARAELIAVRALDPEQDKAAAEAFAAERMAIEEAGEASDADDHAERRELAKAEAS